MTRKQPMTPQDLAKACADALWSGDQCSASLGIQIKQVAPGEATVSMQVRTDMVNGHNICHGGMMFTLADSAFAFACNSYNQFAVAQHCAITFLLPAYLDDELTATAKERVSQGRSGIYDVTITRGDDLIAEFRGHSRTIKGQHVPQQEVSPSV